MTTADLLDFMGTAYPTASIPILPNTSSHNKSQQSSNHGTLYYFSIKAHRCVFEHLAVIHRLEYCLHSCNSSSQLLHWSFFIIISLPRTRYYVFHHKCRSRPVLQRVLLVSSQDLRVWAILAAKTIARPGIPGHSAPQKNWPFSSIYSYRLCRPVPRAGITSFSPDIQDLEVSTAWNVTALIEDESRSMFHMPIYSFTRYCNMINLRWCPMPVRSRKKYSRSAAARKSAPNTDSSGSESSPHTYEPVQYVYDEVNRNVVTWGYILLFISWLIFVGGVGGVLGVWDRVLGFSDNRIMDLSCYFSLIVVTGFVWTVLNWYTACISRNGRGTDRDRVGLKSFRMTSSKVWSADNG